MSMYKQHICNARAVGGLCTLECGEAFGGQSAVFKCSAHGMWMPTADTPLQCNSGLLPPTAIVGREYVLPVPADARSLTLLDVNGKQYARSSSSSSSNQHSPCIQLYTSTLAGDVGGIADLPSDGSTSSSSTETVANGGASTGTPHSYTTHVAVSPIYDRYRSKHVAIVGFTFARCAFFDKTLHSRMPLVPTPARLKRASV
jgi:hypothetical protein